MTGTRLVWSNVILACSFALIVLAALHAWGISRRVERLELKRRTLTEWVDGTQSAGIVTDDRGFILEWNPAATRLLGYTRDDMIGVNIRSLMPVKLAAEHDRFFESPWSDFDAITLTCRLMQKSGDACHVHVAVRCGVGEDGRRLFGVLVDEKSRHRNLGDFDLENGFQSDVRVDQTIRDKRLP